MENKNRHQKLIRNFSIIAHIDHGKSTLADRLLEQTGTVEKRKMKDRILDTLELEQEKGITIKLQTARMIWKVDGEFYILNLIDTPGHVDFSYEVSRSLAACEGALLLVDATQGVEAQTISTIFQALDNNLEIIPVINKIDLPNAEVEKTKMELMNMFGFSESEIFLASGKTGQGVTEILNATVAKIPAPAGKRQGKTRALIFDSFYHEHKGVVALIKLFDGEIAKKSTKLPDIRCVQTATVFEPIEIGYLCPNMTPQNEIQTGEVGYIATGLKDIRDIRVGDTITLEEDFDAKFSPLPGYKKPLSMVYAGLFPVNSSDYRLFRDSIEKLSLNDSAFTYAPETIPSLGAGFRCGFLGLLHLEIIKERLEREFGIEVFITVPSVKYQIALTNNEVVKINSPQDLPDLSEVNGIFEPWAEVEIITPQKYIGNLMELCQDRRGIYRDTKYLHEGSLDEEFARVILRYEMPIAELITDFFDKLKSISQGYASLDYKFTDYREEKIVKVDILINFEAAQPLSFLTHELRAQREGAKIIEILKNVIPKHQFKVPLQAAIGGKIIAREDIPAYRKNVTEKLYGGDITRKMKLREKQKKGKKKLKKFGKVELPTEAFLSVMRKG